MKKDEHFSEEQLNAFVDGELDPEEKSLLYNESARLADLDLRLCQLRKMKELVTHAYDDVPPPGHRPATALGRGGALGRTLAAGIVLIVGLSAGFLAHNYINPQSGNDLSAGTSQPAALAKNYILHVVSGEPEQMFAALREARNLLDSAAPGQTRRVEVVANEKGLNLLRSDVTPFADEIAALQESHVVFYACSRTIERLEEKGVRVQLVPEANYDHTALDRVVTRMKDDWEYLKI